MIRLCVDPLALDILKEHCSIVDDGNSDLDTGYFSFSYFSVFEILGFIISLIHFHFYILH